MVSIQKKDFQCKVGKVDRKNADSIKEFDCWLVFKGNYISDVSKTFQLFFNGKQAYLNNITIEQPPKICPVKPAYNPKRMNRFI